MQSQVQSQRQAAPADVPSADSSRSGAREISYSFFESPLGLLMVAATARGLCFVQFDETEAALRARLEKEYPGAIPTPRPAGEVGGRLGEWIDALSAYLRGTTTALDMPTDVPGTAFQRKVWDCLRRVPCGELRTYKQIAETIGRPTAVRAVGRAIGTNPVGLVVPCHRIVRSGGALGGYRWGTQRKQALIELERRGSQPRARHPRESHQEHPHQQPLAEGAQ